jgi:CheY-like chemotaxis protein/HPt (histidine-containing phosphotransfer) domain-containing protein
MNGIIGAAGLLRDMRLDTEQRDYVRIIRESSDHLSSLIQNILDFSRLDSGRLELDEIAFDPRALIEGTIAMLSGEAEAKGLTLTAAIGGEIPDSVTGDPSRLRQILVNLIGNGIKFTESGGVIVETRVSATDAMTITIGIAVSDSGIGIDLESQRKLFSAFTQVDGSMSRRFDGSGLGLAICKSLIKMMGGTIDLDSAPGLGSTFRFSIRFRHSVMARTAGSSVQAGLVQLTSAPVRPLKVLLAEDNPTNRQVATRMLIRMGHTVEAVEDGAQAVVAAAAGDYDVILMDMMMPEVDGLAATRTIRASAPPRRDIRIVGLTANALASDRAACEAAGMNGFVTKPVTLERLRAALEETVRGHAPVAIRSPNWASPALDAAFLSELAADIGKSCVVEIVRAFLEDAPIRMAAIKGAMEAGAIQTVRREAHALAGAARNVGLTRLGDAAYALQIICGQALPDAAEIEVVAEALRCTLSVATEWADANEDLPAPAM